MKQNIKDAAENFLAMGGCRRFCHAAEGKANQIESVGVSGLSLTDTESMQLNDHFQQSFSIEKIRNANVFAVLFTSDPKE